MLVIISSNKVLENEASIVGALFEEGLSVFHLRKPVISKPELEAELRKIAPKYYNKIVIHSHYELITKYNLRGIHFTNKFLAKSKKHNVEAMYNAVKSKGLTVSTSIHSLEELKELNLNYNYVLLSPVFDSISKPDYVSQAHNFEQLAAYKTNKTKVLALGGITAQNINIAKGMGFDGVALLGSIWTSEDPLQEFIKIKNTYLVNFI